MKIAIAVPLPVTIPQDFMRNLVGIITQTQRDFPDDEIHYFDKAGVRTDRNRNIILEILLEKNFDYVLWLDADMLYPHDIIKTYLQKDFDVMGCLYHKRGDGFAPVAYVKGLNPKKPYRPIDPRLVPKDTVIEVDGLGFGGMMVNMKVYRAMGSDKWMKYSDNFHLPYETDEPKLTHDLMFCQKVQEYGFKIMLHTGVRPGHLSEMPITQEDWERVRVEVEQPRIAVIMPTVNREMAKKTKKILESRAGMDCEIALVYDSEKKGYVWNCNKYVQVYLYDYYVYLTDDIFPSRNWLLDAYNLLIKKDAKMVGFNDGKWKGQLASCALVEAMWMRRNYEGNLFYPQYFGHYNDTELTLIAMQDKVYAYDPNISLIEIDHDKDTKSVNTKDRKLFNKRKETNFNGLVADTNLLNMFK